MALQEFLHPFQAHLPGLERVEGEAQQRRGEDQLLHIDNERNQAPGGQAAVDEPAAAQGQKQQK